MERPAKSAFPRALPAEFAVLNFHQPVTWGEICPFCERGTQKKGMN
jgi:hypothetical protein